MTDKSLAESLSEYVSEELDNISAEVFNNQVCIYSNTSDALSDGSFLSTYICSVQISGDKIMFFVGRSPTSKDTMCIKTFDLYVSDSFDHLFQEIKELIEIHSSISIF